MNTKHLMKKLPSCLLGAILAAGIASSTTVNAVDGTPPGLFELEGNPEGDGGDDWEVLYNFGENDGGSPFAFTEIVPDIATAEAGDRVFTQGGSKDVSDVNQWKYATGSTPDKNEITNAYAAAYTMPADTGPHKAGDLIVYFGLDRFANDGDALAGFWFFQGDVSLGEPSAQGTGDFIGSHVAMSENPEFDPQDPNSPEFLPGDMFIIVNYPQGANAQPEIKVYQWDPNDVDGDVNFDSSEQTKPPKNLSSPLDLVFADAAAKCDGAGDKLACAVTNPADIENSPEWDYTPKSGLATTLPQESLFEGGINVSALLGTTPCFAAFLAETRSSTSQTAQLKDFVFGAFPVCGINVEKDCEANLNDEGTGVDVTFSGTVENTGGSSYIAYVKDDQAGATIDKVCVDDGVLGCADDADISTALNGGAHFPLAGGATVRYEGSYSVDGLPPIPEVTDPPTFALNDEVTVEAYAEVADIGTPALVIVADSDTAGCDYQFTAELGITKNCDLTLGEGAASASVTITGTVTNTGNVPLANLTLTDSDFGDLTLAGVLEDVAGDGVDYLAPGDSENFSKTDSVDYADLDPTPTGTVDGVTTVQLTHKDTIEVEGEVLDSGGTPIGGDDATSDEASCGATLTNGILVEKDCNVALDFSDVTGRIVVRVDVTAEVTNLGSENLSGLALTDDPSLDVGFNVGGAAVPTTLDAGDSFIATGSYFPDTTIGGTDPNPGSASFTDTVDVTASGVFSTLSASDENTAVCDLCPPEDAH
jgi:hypothetical protein